MRLSAQELKELSVSCEADKFLRPDREITKSLLAEVMETREAVAKIERESKGEIGYPCRWSVGESALAFKWANEDVYRRILSLLRPPDKA